LLVPFSASYVLVNVIISPSKDATHIFDGLNDFPTHVAHMRFGSFVTNPAPWDPMGVNRTGILTSAPTHLYGVALQWLKEDQKFRRELENQGQKGRGARRNEVTTSQS
jgi:CCR4-NOT complex subunit CAF16